MSRQLLACALTCCALGACSLRDDPALPSPGGPGASGGGGGGGSAPAGGAGGGGATGGSGGSGLTACGNELVSLLDDTEHCGACEVACPTGCQAGSCQIAADPDGGWAIYLTQNHVYWSRAEPDSLTLSRTPIFPLGATEDMNWPSATLIHGISVWTGATPPTLTLIDGEVPKTVPWGGATTTNILCGGVDCPAANLLVTPSDVNAWSSAVGIFAATAATPGQAAIIFDTPTSSMAYAANATIAWEDTTTLPHTIRITNPVFGVEQDAVEGETNGFPRQMAFAGTTLFWVNEDTGIGCAPPPSEVRSVDYGEPQVYAPIGADSVVGVETDRGPAVYFGLVDGTIVRGPAECAPLTRPLEVISPSSDPTARVPMMAVGVPAEMLYWSRVPGLSVAGIGGIYRRVIDAPGLGPYRAP